MTNTDKVLHFLRSVAPQSESNSEIVAHTGIRPHQQVFQITQRLLKAGRIKGVKEGKDWIFWIEKGSDERRAVGSRPVPRERSTVAARSSGAALVPKSVAVPHFRVVIQCAASKAPEAGQFRDRHGGKLLFVARPEEAPLKEGIHYVRPDDLSDDGALTWRERLHAYNSENEGNPLGLLPAYRLYTHAAYRNLVQAFGVEKVFILSAGWGLIRADFLTPSYDITFSNAAERYKRRGQRDRYADFRQLRRHGSEPIVFLGGKDYQPLFERLTAHIEAEKVIFHRSDSVPQRRGFGYVKYDTPARTNWHYLCVRDLLAGQVRVPLGREP